MAKARKEPDVTVATIDATTADETRALTHIAADARLLAGMRHPKVVPVVDARWRGPRRLEITRERVRGTSLVQAATAIGPMPEARVIALLREIAEVLEWAGRGGIGYRHLSPERICFTEPGGQLMLSFGLPATVNESEPGVAHLDVPALERCADAATLARLGFGMLTGDFTSIPSAVALRAARPDVSEGLAAAIEAGLQCETSSRPLSARQFGALLDGAAERGAGPAAIAAAASAPVIPRGATTPLPEPVLPLGGPQVGNPGSAPSATGARARTATPAAHHVAPAHSTPRRRRGRGLVVASFIALAVLVGSTFALIHQDRESRGADVATAERADEASGDVDVMEPLPPDPGGLTTDSSFVAPGARPLADSLPSRLPMPLPEQLPPRGVQPPAADQPPVEMREPQEPLLADVPAPVQPENACESPTNAAQQDCLRGMIAVNDQELTSVYQALVRAVADRDGAAAAEAIRADQRAWLARRDAACRGSTAEGQLWARARGACLAQQSDARALELARALAAARAARP